MFNAQLFPSSDRAIISITYRNSPRKNVHVHPVCRKGQITFSDIHHFFQFRRRATIFGFSAGRPTEKSTYILRSHFLQISIRYTVHLSSNHTMELHLLSNNIWTSSTVWKSHRWTSSINTNLTLWAEHMHQPYTRNLIDACNNWPMFNPHSAKPIPRQGRTRKSLSTSENYHMSTRNLLPTYQNSPILEYFHWSATSPPCPNLTLAFANQCSPCLSRHMTYQVFDQHTKCQLNSPSVARTNT